MHRTNIKETVRWALKKKANTALIICGMSIGIAVALLIGLWGINEFSFDKFHANADRIYRICRQLTMNNETIAIGSDFFPIGEAVKEEFPQVEDFCRVTPFERRSIKIQNKVVYQNKIGAVAPNFFRFFSFELKSGNPVTCLDAPNKIVIDRETAEKYFSDMDPLGQIIEMFGRKLQVSAVMENMPDNSHLKFHIIIPVSAVSWLKDSEWGESDNVLTYLLLKKGTNIETLAKNITALTYKHFPLYEKLKASHFLQPLTEIHFSPGFRFDFVKTSDRRTVFIFISLTALILMIAIFNFVNLFISTSFLKAKSIGVKKINGSSKTSLFLASYIETGSYVFIATCIALLLTTAFLPAFNHLAGSHLKLNFGDYPIYLFSGILFVFTVLIAGTFPVIYILRFNPVEIIRNRFRGGGITLLQRGLVISQFAASIILISSAGIIQKQIQYVKNKDLGFNNEHVLYLFPNHMSKNYSAVHDQLLKNPNVVDVTAKNCLPNEWNQGNDVSLADNSGMSVIMEICRVKENYLDMLQMSIIKGRNPFEKGKENNLQCLINEQAAQQLGLSDPVGKQIKRADKVFTIAGVLKNANTKSLHRKVDPQVYFYLNQLRGYNPILIKTTGQPASVIQLLEKLWEQYNPDVPFEYHFLDYAYDQLYKTEKTASKIVIIGMSIAFFLAFMGLYAVAHYATERRVKEIGIRKVNGARITEVLILMNRDFIFWVLISIIIATPITWLLLHKWLENFAYKTSLSWWIFALAGVLALGIALLTVSFQSYKAAVKNPVESLRYE